MTNITFGDYIRKRREEKGLPLRKIAVHLDIDISTFSKVERGKRLAAPNDLSPLAEMLELDLKEVQMTFNADKINKGFGALEHLIEGL